MRVPLLDRINPKYIAILGTALFVGQVVEGTNVLFALLTTLYVTIWTIAFNTTGGITYPSGAYIFMNGFLSVVLGLCLKVILLQPGDSNLKAPITTMCVYCVGMAGMAIPGFLTTRLRTRRSILPQFHSLVAIKRAAITFLVVGPLIELASLGRASNPIISALRQVNRMTVFAVILATVYQVRVSKGKSSFNWINITAISYTIAVGAFAASKEGMLTGCFALLVTLAVLRFDFKPALIIGIIVGASFFIYYLVPYSQYIRSFRGNTATETAAVDLNALANLGETRRLYEDAIAQVDINEEAHLFDKRMGFLDRLIITAPDDQLIAFTEQGNVSGISPMIASYANVIPRVIWPNKPTLNTGNVFAHELGNVLADEDETTGISFSPTADAFHEASWLGLLLLLPVNLFLYFIISDSVYGSAKTSLWAILPIFLASTIGPQGGMNMPIWELSYGVVGIFVISAIGLYLGPAIIRVFARNSADGLSEGVIFVSGADSGVR